MKKNIKRALICIYFVLLCCVFVSTALSKNTTKVKGTGTADVAGIRLNVTTATTNTSNISNTEKSIDFTVKNYDGEKTNPVYSDIQYDYKVTISVKNNTPLVYTLYRVTNGAETPVTLTKGESGTFTMPHSKVQEDTFRIKLKLEDSAYQNISDVIDINVYAVQSK